MTYKEVSYRQMSIIFLTKIRPFISQNKYLFSTAIIELFFFTKV